MTTEKSKADDDAQIRQLIDVYVRAIRAKDFDTVMSVYAPDIVSFNIEPPLQYVRTKRWKQTFATYDGPMGYEVRDLSITPGEDVAFAHGLDRSSGTLKNGNKTDSWVRWTACLRKINDQWLITYDHVSVPVDFESGKAVLDLTP